MAPDHALTRRARGERLVIVAPASLVREFRRLLLVAAALAVFLRPFAAGAQPARNVTVHVNAPESIYVGDSGDLQVIVRGSQNVDRPDVPESPDYEVAYRGPQNLSSSTTIILNGRVSRQENIGFAHVFKITPRHTGTIVIPSFAVVCDGRTYRTNEVRINAIAPSQTGDYRLKLVPQKTRVYVGEPIRLSLTWLLGKPVKEFALSMPDLPVGVELQPTPDPRPQGQRQPDNHFVEVPLDGETAIGTLSRGDLDGREVDAVTIDRILIAHTPGTVQFGPARADFNAVIGERPRRFMDAPWTDLSIVERQSTSSKPFDLEVLPLPTEGRPADFSGLVGDYSIVASAEPTDVSVGEPITFRVTVNGPQPLSLIPLIDLNTQPALASKFRVPRDPVLPTFTPVGAMFTYTLRARSPDQKQIPPVELSYFDTTNGRFQTARSNPITITVRPSTGVDIEFDESTPAVAAAVKPSSRVDTSPLSLTGASFDFTSTLARPATIAALAAPPAAFLALWLGLAVKRHNARDPARVRRRRAVRRARSRLGRITITAQPVAAATESSHTLTELAADWFDRPAGSLTSGEAVALLTNDADATAGQLGRLLADCDRIRFGYGGDGLASAPLLDRSREVLTQVARRLEDRA